MSLWLEVRSEFASAKNTLENILKYDLYRKNKHINARYNSNMRIFFGFILKL